MDFGLWDLIGLAAALAGGAQIASARLARKRNLERSGAKGWLLLLAVLLLHFVIGNDSFWLDLARGSRDIGAGLLLAALPLWLRNAGARPFALAGVVLLGVGLTGSLLTCASRSCGAGEEGAEQAELLLELGPDDSIEELSDLLEEHDATYEDAFPEVDMSEDVDLAQYFLVTVPADQLDALLEALREDTENVDSVEPNSTIALDLPEVDLPDRPLEGDLPSNDPRLREQWGLEHAHGIEAIAWLRNQSPDEIATIAIVDTGVAAAHEDIEAVFDESPGDTDVQGHGSHCAGIAGAVTNNNTGIASLNWQGKFVHITGYKALNDNGFGTVESVAQAIINAAEDGADVISLSLGGYSPTPPKAEVDAIEYALELGAIVVVAAGNEDDDARNHAPANIPGVIVVGAVGPDGSKAYFSNTTDHLEMPIAAPGVDILSLDRRGGYVSMSGTSMATPMVAGLLGIMRSLEPDLTPERAYQLLVETGIAGPDTHRIGKTINARAVLEALTR